MRTKLTAEGLKISSDLRPMYVAYGLDGTMMERPARTYRDCSPDGDMLRRVFIICKSDDQRDEIREATNENSFKGQTSKRIARMLFGCRQQSRDPLNRLFEIDVIDASFLNHLAEDLNDILPFSSLRLKRSQGRTTLQSQKGATN